jgi:hypothetical protein
VVPSAQVEIGIPETRFVQRSFEVQFVVPDDQGGVWAVPYVEAVEFARALSRQFDNRPVDQSISQPIKIARLQSDILGIETH